MIEGFTKQFDPNGVYKNIPEDHLKEMCGIVPNFSFNRAWIVRTHLIA